MRRTHRFLSRATVAVVALVAFAVALPPAAGALDDSLGDQVVLTGRVEVHAGEVVDTVVIFDGPAVVEGRVTGSVTAFNGAVTIARGAVVEGDVTVLKGSAGVAGRVDGNVVVTSGRARVAPGATVGGDVESSLRPVVAESARVGGDVSHVNWGRWWLWMRIFALVAVWFAVTISALALGIVLLLLLPKPMEAAAATARRDPGPSAGWGAIVSFGAPLAAIVALVTVVAVPLGLAVLGASGLLLGAGYVVASLTLGRLMLPGRADPFVPFLLGLAVLRVAGLVPFLGWLATLAASAFGLGAAAVAAWRAAHPTAPPVVPSVPDHPELPWPELV
jgi:cytoskeletal protein CcmA (bactofilin family)